MKINFSRFKFIHPFRFAFTSLPALLNFATSLSHFRASSRQNRADVREYRMESRVEQVGQ